MRTHDWTPDQKVTVVGSSSSGGQPVRVTTIAAAGKRKVTTRDGGEWDGPSGREFGHSTGIYQGQSIRLHRDGDEEIVTRRNMAFHLRTTIWDELDTATLRACWAAVKSAKVPL